MKLPSTLYSVMLGVVLVSSTSCNQLLTTIQTTARADGDSGNLIQAVRDYAPTTIPAALKVATQMDEHAPTLASSSPETETEEQYRSQIAADLVQKDYDALEKNAQEDRAEKTRFVGGVWKLLIFYEGLTNPIVGSQASDSDWNAHIRAFEIVGRCQTRIRQCACGTRTNVCKFRREGTWNWLCRHCVQRRLEAVWRT